MKSPAHLAFSLQGQQYPFTVLPQEYISSPDCHNLVYRDPDCLSIPHGITLVYYIDGIMLIEPNEKETATTLELLIKHLCARR